MTRLFGKVTVAGAEYRIVHDSKLKYNPYKVIQKTYDPALGYRVRTINKFGDLTSCLYLIANISKHLES